MAYLSDIEIAQQCEMKHICEIAKKADVDMKYIEQYGNTEVKNDYSEILEFKVNGMGALVYYSRSRKNLETGEIEKYLEFKLCDGVCLGMGEPMPHFDPIYFAIPSTSEELMKEFELINET